jgi:hypothetical protein
MSQPKKKPRKSPDNQAARFIEAAKKAGVDESGRAFSRAMGKITLAKNARKATRAG